MEHLTQIVLDQVESLGYDVRGEIDHGQVVFTAVDRKTGERLIVHPITRIHAGRGG